MAGYQDDEYDSDAEASCVAPPPTDPFVAAGQKSILHLLAHPETRLTSKVRAKNVTQGGTWAERYICALWANRFQAWRVGVLKADPESTPTGEQVCRFLTSFVEVYNEHVASRKGTLSYDTMVHATKKLKKAMTFKYEEFELKSYWKLRIDGVLGELVDEGLLTREQKRSIEPAGAVVMRRVIRTLYEDAISNGTTGWNTTLNDIAALLLLTALGTRAGDILGETKDTRPDLAGLRYSDVKLVVVSNGWIEGQFCIRSAKGKKRDGKAYHYLLINEQRSPLDNIMCPVKLLVVLALRSGNTDGTTFRDVISMATARTDKRIQWKFPDRPVACAVKGAGIAWSKLATKQRANRALQKALAAMGLDGTVTLSPHQTRYGAATDLTLTKSQITAHTKQQISDFLGHGHQSRMRDTVVTYTRKYTSEETWTARVALTEKDDKFSELVNRTDLRKKRSRAENEEGDDGQPRKRAFSSAPPDNDIEDQETDGSVDEGDQDIAFDVDDIVGTHLDEDSKDADTIDILSEALTSSADNSVDNLVTALTAARGDFVDTFGRVNIVRAPRKGSKGLEYARRCGEDSDNSVNPAVQFTFRCRNAGNGCPYAGAKDVDILGSHELTCTFTEPNGKPAVERKETKQFACGVKDCNKAYNGQRELESHDRDVHRPVQCFVAGCTEKRAYVGQKALLEHVKVAHPAKGCLHPKIPDQVDAMFECTEDFCSEQFHHFASNNFTARKFLVHLLKEHNIRDKADRESRVPSWRGNPCFFPGCTSEDCFPQTKEGRKSYNAHLAAEHDVEDEAEQFEYSWARVRGVLLPLRSEVATKGKGTRNARKAPRTSGRRVAREDSDEE